MAQSTPAGDSVGQPTLAEIKTGQNITLAILAGIGTAVAGAVLWAVITVVTKMELGLAAIAIGYVVGQAVRAAGKGLDSRFGIVGALCALFGCVLGNALSALAFYAQGNGLSTSALVGILTPDLVERISVAFFQPMDLLFYAIAVYEGYRFSFRYRMRKVAQS